ncbi:aldo/keto reductase [Sulfuriflexus mobilis]|uniref:aldo/keto reductase n=1 Tax=Sulfuriflexus mobilis TaxID=1811807 RepID=UPI000F8302D3|nr:aldo/keto reductase [Sulfuriflexus mobilis]
MKDQHNRSRRRFLQLMALGVAGGISGLAVPRVTQAGTGSFITKPIPSTHERLPVIGLGSSRTFNVGNDPLGLDNVAEVMRHFFNAGGRLIDSSPMYGSSQPAIGYGLKKLGKTKTVFSADKVWTWDHDAGPAQMEQSRRYWQVDAFDLMQVHNLVAWEQHLKTLARMKQQGKIRYVGITTSHGRRHEEMEHIMKTEPLDFVQFSYNILDREAEARLLPLAAERGIAVIVNRPFQRGDLIEELKHKPLPEWAKTIDCKNWPQFLLKFVASHPAVTCVIPATTQIEHVKENMAAGFSPMPDGAMRARMIDYVEKIL